MARKRGLTPPGAGRRPGRRPGSSDGPVRREPPSAARTFTALLLVNPRIALIGLETTNLYAAAHVRGGLTVVETRPERVVQLPDIVVLDRLRLLTDGLEVAGFGGVVGRDPGHGPLERGLGGGGLASVRAVWRRAHLSPRSQEGGVDANHHRYSTSACRPDNRNWGSAISKCCD